MITNFISFLNKIDVNWFNQINQSPHNSYFDLFMPLISKAGDGGMIWIACGLVLFVFGKKESKKASFLVLTALFASYLTGEEVLKHIFHRPRPFLTIPWVNLLVQPPGSLSFPSAHAANAFASGLVLARKIPALTWPVFILAVLMAFSRVYVGVHYPFDVLAGSLVGIICALLVLKYETVLFSAMKRITTPFHTTN